MFKNLFKSHLEDGTENPDEEFQLPSLHRREITMTAALVRRMEEEKLCERYHLSLVKDGEYF